MLTAGCRDSTTGCSHEPLDAPLPPPAPAPPTVAPRVLVDGGIGELGDEIVRAAEKARARVADVEQLLGRGASPASFEAAVVLLGRTSADGQPSEGLVEVIREGHPHVSVWICARPEEKVGRLVVRYANAGAGWVFEIGAKSELAALVQMLETRVQAPVPSGLVWQVARAVRARRTRFLAIDCLVESFRPRRVAEVERRFGHDHKTLNALLEREHLVTIGQLHRAGRLAHVEELRRRGVPRERIARVLRFRSSKGIREMWRAAEGSGLVQGGEIVVFRG